MSLGGRKERVSVDSSPSLLSSSLKGNLPSSTTTMSPSAIPGVVAETTRSVPVPVGHGINTQEPLSPPNNTYPHSTTGLESSTRHHHQQLASSNKSELTRLIIHSPLVPSSLALHHATASSPQSASSPIPSANADLVKLERKHAAYLLNKKQKTASPAATIAGSYDLTLAEHHQLMSFRPPSYRHTPQARRSKSPILYSVTTHLLSTYSKCNPDFVYEYLSNPRRVLTKPAVPALNDGFDNEEHDYILFVNDILGEKENQQYQIIDIMGQGTFGQVVKCINLKSRDSVAVKVIKNKPAYYNQSLVEVTILDLLNNQHDRNDKHHIVRMRDTFIFRNHLCIVFEILSVNLYELIKQNQFRGLSTNLVKVFATQLLDCLIVLHKARIIHSDLKPENILLKTLDSPEIKIIDFGSACHENQTIYTYIQSRFYRSPEVLMGLPYSLSIDMWSLGCIVAELFLGLPIFPGSSEYNQIARIVEMLGVPPNYMCEKGKNAKLFFDRCTEFDSPRFKLKSMEAYMVEQNVTEAPSKRYFNEIELVSLIQNYPMTRKNMGEAEILKEREHRAAFVDFLQGLLCFNPLERWSPYQAKNHPFITGEKFTGPYTPSAIPRHLQMKTNPSEVPGLTNASNHAHRNRPRASTVSGGNIQAIPHQLQHIPALQFASSDGVDPYSSGSNHHYHQQQYQRAYLTGHADMNERNFGNQYPIQSHSIDDNQLPHVTGTFQDLNLDNQASDLTYASGPSSRMSRSQTIINPGPSDPRYFASHGRFTSRLSASQDNLMLYYISKNQSLYPQDSAFSMEQEIHPKHGVTGERSRLPSRRPSVSGQSEWDPFQDEYSSRSFDGNNGSRHGSFADMDRRYSQSYFDSSSPVRQDSSRHSSDRSRTFSRDSNMPSRRNSYVSSNLPQQDNMYMSGPASFSAYPGIGYRERSSSGFESSSYGSSSFPININRSNSVNCPTSSPNTTALLSSSSYNHRNPPDFKPPHRYGDVPVPSGSFHRNSFVDGGHAFPALNRSSSSSLHDEGGYSSSPGGTYYFLDGVSAPPPSSGPPPSVSHPQVPQMHRRNPSHSSKPRNHQQQHHNTN